MSLATSTRTLKHHGYYIIATKTQWIDRSTHEPGPASFIGQVEPMDRPIQAPLYVSEARATELEVIAECQLWIDGGDHVEN